MTRIYNNGNYQVHLLEDGTKKRLSLDGTFVPKRVETLDINLSNRCSIGCSYCYINATPTGRDGDIANLFDYGIPNGTELAFNYNGSHIDFDYIMDNAFNPFSNWIINLTINHKLLNIPTYKEKLQSWIDRKRVAGIGVSTNKFLPDFQLVSPNIVYHTIAGITPTTEIIKMLEANQKVLILGFKQLGRASTLPDLSSWNIDSILAIKKGILSFDNLALDQLDIKSRVSPQIWDAHYMGEEGTTSFYIDLVSETFSQSSIDSEVKFTCKDLKIKDMFEIIKRRIR